MTTAREAALRFNPQPITDPERVAEAARILQTVPTPTAKPAAS